MQAMFVPIVHHVIAIAILRRKPLTLVSIVVRNRATRTADIGFTGYELAVRRRAAVVVVIVLLRECGTGRAEYGYDHKLRDDSCFHS
jgi:hypothetical protein